MASAAGCRQKAEWAVDGSREFSDRSPNMLEDPRIAEESRLLHDDLVDQDIQLWPRLIEIRAIRCSIRQAQLPASGGNDPAQACGFQHRRIDPDGRRQAVHDGVGDKRCELNAGTGMGESWSTALGGKGPGLTLPQRPARRYR